MSTGLARVSAPAHNAGKMNATSAPTRSLRTRLGLAVIPVSCALAAFVHASGHAASHPHSLIMVLPLATVDAPFVPAPGLGLALIVGSAMGWCFVRRYSARRALARV